MQQLKTILTAILMLCCTTMSAHDFEVDGIYYNITGANTVEVTYRGTSYISAKSYSGSVTIPSSVTYNGTTYSITTIGFGSFYGCSSLTNIEIPNSVTTIKVAAFMDCSSLKSIEIPNNTTTIGDHAFGGCSSLTSIEIPNNVTTIEINAFRDCSRLTSIVIPNSITAIGFGAFSGCRSLTSIEIPNSVTTIGDDAFYATPWYNNQPDGVVYAGKVLYTYKGTMPANTSISIKEGTAGIAGGAFENCNNLTSIRIPNSVKTIGDNAFKGCSSLESIEIPNSVTTIGERAFESCTGLTSIEIPNSVTTIGDYAFLATTWYNNQPDGVVYAGKVLYKYKGTMPANTSISIKEGTLSITNYAFSNCNYLTSIEIPNSVTTIGMGAFEYCSNLTGIDIPKSVTNIGHGAFRNCTSITHVTIPNGVTAIGQFAFDCCKNLTHVTLPSTITSIGYDGFANCFNLTTFISLIPADKLFIPDNGGLRDIKNTNCTLYVPYGAKETYAAIEGWKDFTNIVELPAEPFALTVSAAKYATLYLNYNAIIPEGVEVYTASTVDGNRLMMQQVTGTLPANTGVIVRAEQGTYAFEQSIENAEEIENNLFRGSVEDEYITPENGYKYYVLSMKDGIVGMYADALTGGTFKNNANKAYLVLVEKNLDIYDEEVDTENPGMQLSNSYYFDFSGTTAIDPVVTEVNDNIYYDLSGRRVENPTRGIYILNGNKVFVK